MNVRGRAGTDLPFWVRAAAVLFWAVLYTLSTPLAVAHYGVGLVLGFVLATVQSGSLVLAVVRPVAGVALQLLSVVVVALVTRDSGVGPWPLPLTGLISLGALILLLGLRERWIVSVTTWWVSIVVIIAVIAASPERYEVADEWGTNLTLYSTYTLTVLAAAIAVGQRRRIRAELAAARRDIELEQAQRRYVEERSRIARELHDVVAHSMSLVHMQALSAPYRLREAPRAAVDDEFQGIARSARAALAEMRQLLGALRADDEAADTRPQPQLDDIAQLVDATSRAGVPIEAEVDAAAGTASSIVQLTAYRIVQEALSNVVRHAPAVATTVAVRAESTALRVSVRNARPGVLPVPGGADGLDRGGQGLRGMRERVELLGGRLTAGSTPEGGFAVDATIPATIEHQPETP